MPPPLRPLPTPRCSACLRNYAFGPLEPTSAPRGLQQQTRGKKKMANNSASVPVRLLKDVATFGRKGAIVPIARGQMRNKWFPDRIAEYVTVPEMRTLRLNQTATTDRDFNFGSGNLADSHGTTSEGVSPWKMNMPSDIKGMSTSELQSASAFQRSQIEKVSPQRSIELVEIFVPKRLEFYRQPIMEEADDALASAAAEQPKRQRFTAGGAAGDLLAARQKVPAVEKARERAAREGQAIYGSVSVQDVLVAVRAAMEGNEEAATVALQEGDIRFVGQEVLKRTGDFGVEIRVKGAERSVTRTVRVIAQDM